MAVDAYRSMLDTEQALLETKDKYIKNDLKQACTTADENVDAKYTDFRVAEALSNQCNQEQQSVQKKIDDLKAEMNLKINRAVSDGASDTEIDSIKAQYGEQIALLQSNLSSMGETNTTKQDAFKTAKSEYSKSRFNKIFTDGNYLSALQSQFSDWLNLGKMKQSYQVSLQAQTKGLNLLG